jgi:hypothetical protein
MLELSLQVPSGVYVCLLGMDVPIGGIIQYACGCITFERAPHIQETLSSVRHVVVCLVAALLQPLLNEGLPMIC